MPIDAGTSAIAGQLCRRLGQLGRLFCSVRRRDAESLLDRHHVCIWRRECVHSCRPRQPVDGLQHSQLLDADSLSEAGQLRRRLGQLGRL